MAQSPAHRFGQIIGDVLEAGIVSLLATFAGTHGLYLDKKGERPCRRGSKCAWIDLNGNSHDLDFVLERGGSLDKLGTPAAFIETAWRRYTKHSRNKVQEIQGAIEPLAETYRNSAPFKGVILAGVFTNGALTQLKSLGFTVLFFPYETVVKVFQSCGIDARFDENTPDRIVQGKVDAYQSLSQRRKSSLGTRLVRSHQAEVDAFLASLAVAVSRQIDCITILALHGKACEVATVNEAIRFVEEYNHDGKGQPIQRYEIEVRYNNGDRIHGDFKDKASAVGFLRNYQPAAPISP